MKQSAESTLEVWIDSDQVPSTLIGLPSSLRVTTTETLERGSTSLTNWLALRV